MNDNTFDALTVSLGSTVSLREGLRLIGEFLASQVSPFFGGPPPSAVPASTIRPCLTINDDGLCSAGEKSRLSGFTAEVNGCGAASGKKFAESYGKANWRSACDIHDRCYTNCTTPKQLCDINIEVDIANACRTGYPGQENTVHRRECYSIARDYRNAVLLFGKDAWIQGQKEGCRCCANCESGLGACGTQCCAIGEMCCEGRCVREGQCCPGNQIYCAGQCIDSSQRQCCRIAAGEFICATHQACCGNGTCCNAGSTCCERNGVRSCIPLGDQNCRHCHPCPSNQQCCLSPWGTSYGCCGPNEKCDPILSCVRKS